MREKIIDTNLPSLENVFNERTNKKAKRILDDRDHPANHLFELLPSKKRYRSIQTKTSRFRNSFYPTAVRIISSNF